MKSKKDFKSILENISKFKRKIFPEMWKAKEGKFRKTLSSQRRSIRFENVEIENSPYKIGTLVMVKNAKKSIKKSLMEPEFVGPYKIKVIKSNNKVDLAHPTDKELTLIKEFRNVPISMLKLFQGGDVDTKDDLEKLDRVHSITLDDKSGGNVVIIIN
jgi:hypothetical protein